MRIKLFKWRIVYSRDGGVTWWLLLPVRAR